MGEGAGGFGDRSEREVGADRIARNGFYTFNVDIYIDTDRIAGRGETSTLPGRGVAVARNAEVVHRSQWHGTALADGDDIELVTAVQGG